MTSHQPESRISRISTLWTMLLDAHDEDLRKKYAAQTRFFERYQRAIEKYLLAVLRDANLAEEVFSKFAEDFLKGSFHKANPDRGQFRHYLKRSLVNAARNCLKKSRTTSANVPLDENRAVQEDELSTRFEWAWKTELLNKAWEALKEKDEQTGRNYFTILQVASDHSELPGRELLELTIQTLDEKGLLKKQEYAAGTWRKDLSRARLEYAGMLVQEIGRSIDNESLDAIEEEAAACGLLSYCKPVIARLRKPSRPTDS
ncbi:MAG: sigma-70 family RNA polymerase sigma factor [Planctomycetaceae bacterium]|nr:sigma-70 family RNA polymerase sigma factor [Planctomycetaceae bacterium]